MPWSTKPPLLAQYDDEAREFFARVLNLDYEACQVDDHSLLAEFSNGILCVAAMPLGAPLNTLHAPWSALVLERIERQYGLRLGSTHLTLVVLFEMLRAHARPATVH